MHRGASPFLHPLVDPISHKITDGTDLHVFAIGLGELRPAGLAVHDSNAPGSLGLLDEAAFQVADVSLCQRLVLAHEEHDVIPEIPGQVTPKAVPNALGLADVDGGVSGLGIDAGQEVHAGVDGLITGQDGIELRARTGNRLSRPVRKLRCAEALRISVDEE